MYIKTGTWSRPCGQGLDIKNELQITEEASNRIKMQVSELLY